MSSTIPSSALTLPTSSSPLRSGAATAVAVPPGAGELHPGELAQLEVTGADHPVLADGGGLLGRHGDGVAAGGEDQAATGGEPALGVERQAAVAREGRGAGRGADRQEGAVLRVEVERVAGTGGRAGLEVDPGAHRGGVDLVLAATGWQKSLEGGASRPEAGGLGVGEVVGDRVELIRSRHRAAHAHIESVRHLALVPPGSLYSKGGASRRRPWGRGIVSCEAGSAGQEVPGQVGRCRLSQSAYRRAMVVPKKTAWLPPRRDSTSW